MYHLITEIQNMLHKFVPIESSSGWSNFLRHQWLMSKCFLKRNIAMRTWRSKAFQWGKCGLSSEMRPKCRPFHHFGSHAEQVCNCRPLRKHWMWYEQPYWYDVFVVIFKLPPHIFIWKSKGLKYEHHVFAPRGGLYRFRNPEIFIFHEFGACFTFSISTEQNTRTKNTNVFNFPSLTFRIAKTKIWKNVTIKHQHKKNIQLTQRSYHHLFSAG